MVQVDIKAVKHIDISRNFLQDLNRLDAFHFLESLVTDHNYLQEINLRELTNLKMLSVISNHLTTLQVILNLM
jgi:Leucine-rich repeat (LRR) protein